MQIFKHPSIGLALTATLIATTGHSLGNVGKREGSAGAETTRV